MLKKNYKYIILWWWLSWLSTAYKLSEKNIWNVLLIEKESVLWWLARWVEKYWDTLDYWSHRLQSSFDKWVLDFLSNKLKLYLFNVKRLSKLNIKNSYVSYPIKSISLFKKLNFLKSLYSILQSLYYKITIKDQYSFEKKAKARVWNYIYNKFYKPYAIKVWNIDLDILSSSVVKKRFSLKPLEVIKELFSNKNHHFIYIKWWFWKISNKFENELLKNKVNILKDTSDYKLDLKNNKIVLNWDEIWYENLISTIPLTTLINISWNNNTFNWKEVWYRGIYIVYLYLNKQPLISWETFYFPEKDYIFWRVSIPERFDENMFLKNDYTVYTCEIPANKWDFNEEELISLAYKNLLKSNLVDKSIKLDVNKSFFLHSEHVYPMYKVWWEGNVKHILDHFSSTYNNLYISWRPWLFLHCNTDHSMKVWFELWDYLLKNNDNKWWLKNIDKYFNFVVRD